MSDQPTDFPTVLRGRGFRMTPQREIILEAIGAGHGHTDFDEIFARVQARSPSMNRATVYRTLEFLHQQRLISSAEIGGETVYEIAKMSHTITWCVSTAAPPNRCRTMKSNLSSTRSAVSTNSRC